MIHRTNVSWDLSRAGHTLSVYWTQPGEKPSVPSRRSARFEQDVTPWQPWQIEGVLRSLRSGVPLEEVCAGDRPRLHGLAAAATTVGEALLRGVDLLLGRRSLA